MSEIYTIIIVILAILAVSGLFVGVTNDAVNFLNSAIGSRAASMRMILLVASVGILVGVVTSSGMMEVARNGMFNPGLFTFHEVMMLYLGVMFANIILLDLYNSWGLPTSTTVSLVFCLLGAAIAVTVYKITGSADAGHEMGEYINTSRALGIVSAILLSVVIAFTCGTAVMYVSRLIFSFRYTRVFSRFGAFWCGASLTAIVYFALFKGLRNILEGHDFIRLVDSHLPLALTICWAVCSLLLLAVQKLKINILRVTILAGTFALALAFAGNDLVNFIGVPVAGFDAYHIAREAGTTDLLMEGLNENVPANFLVLLGAGLIMILTLWTSKKAMHVTETEISLSSQRDEAEQQYGSSFISRTIVRAALGINAGIERVVPRRVREAIGRRFEYEDVEHSGAPYDMIRATVNLTTSALLISIATSLKLPLSTTYVCFMVAMGSSLADRTWGRESAVYRITGVMAVISGWFITALGGFLIAFGVTLLLLWGGWIAVTVLVALCAWLLVRSHRNVEQIKAAETKESPVVKAETPDEVLCVCIGEVCTTMEQVTRIYNRTLVAVFKENRKVLKEMVQSSNRLFEEARDRKYGIMPTLRRLQQCDIDTGHFYVQVVDYLSEVTKALIHITRPAFGHIDNNHEGLSKEQIVDLMRVNDQVEAIFDKINDMLRTKDFSDLDMVLEMRDKLFDTIVEAIKNQLRRINGDPAASTRASVLYLTILNETKTMILQARNLLKSQHYFLESRK